MVYDDTFVEQLAKYIPHLKEAKFYGGEPFLIPIYYKIWDKVKQLNPNLELFLITNGMHWNNKIEKLVTELNFDLAVSIDAYDKEKLERIRKNVVQEKLLDNIRRFSEICNKKGKHLSLSFTIQKDNWDQLPLIINLCNEVNAYIYVSYLERPIRFALTDCTKEELIEIRDYMNTFSFPIFTQKERHNKNCFEDFKNYLNTYIENSEEKKYYEYRFDNDKLFEKTENMDAIAPSSMPLVNPLTHEEWTTFVDNYYEREASLKAILPKEIFYQKVKSVIQDFAEDEQAHIRGTMTGVGFDQILESIKHFPEEELRRLSRLQLNAYNKTKSVEQL